MSNIFMAEKNVQFLMKEIFLSQVDPSKKYYCDFQIWKDELPVFFFFAIVCFTTIMLLKLTQMSITE